MLSEETKITVNKWLLYKCAQAQVDTNDTPKVLNVLWSNFHTAKNNTALLAELAAGDAAAKTTNLAALKSKLEDEGYTVTDPS